MFMIRAVIVVAPCEIPQQSRGMNTLQIYRRLSLYLITLSEPPPSPEISLQINSCHIFTLKISIYGGFPLVSHILYRYAFYSV